MPYHYLFVGLWAIFAGYWIYGAWGNKRTVYRFNPLWRLLVVAVLAAFLAVSSRYPGVFLKRYLPFSEPVEWLSLLLCAFGVGFAIWARRTLGRNWSGNPTVKEGHELIQRGPYALVRHPIYTGLFFACVGTALGSGKPREAILLLVAIVSGLAKMRIEEALITREFPVAYPEYRKRTKAILPFVL